MICPDFVLTMSGQCPDFVRTKSGHCPDKIRTLSRQNPDIVLTESGHCCTDCSRTLCSDSLCYCCRMHGFARIAVETRMVSWENQKNARLVSIEKSTACSVFPSPPPPCRRGVDKRGSPGRPPRNLNPLSWPRDSEADVSKIIILKFRIGISSD